jgi:hypothetical protein
VTSALQPGGAALQQTPSCSHLAFKSVTRSHVTTSPFSLKKKKMTVQPWASLYFVLFYFYQVDPGKWKNTLSAI